MEHLEFSDSKRIDAIEADPKKMEQLKELFAAVGMDPSYIMLTDSSTFSDFIWQVEKFPDVDYSWLPGERSQEYIYRLAPIIAQRTSAKFRMMFDTAPADLWKTTVVDFFDLVYNYS